MKIYFFLYIDVIYYIKYIYVIKKYMIYNQGWIYQYVFDIIVIVVVFNQFINL